MPKDLNSGNQSGRQRRTGKPAEQHRSHGKPNRLVHETSPYLRQHARNPVDWYPWGDEALDRARRENRLIFLSIGYSSCHWCHVMEHESFEDPEIARLLNKYFVNIKVDREERPDIDSLYMESLQLMTGQGGWPLNVWLTPDQIPIFAGTYFPPQDYYGRPGFPAVIKRLEEVYRKNPEKVKKQAAEMRKALNEDLFDHLSPGPVNDELLKKAVHVYSNSYDQEYGGFSNAPKFPAAMGIGFLMRYGHRPGSETARNMALSTLEKMVNGGIYDQVGGGFHRYSTDDQWHVPHFEKMLYDNALLLSVLSEAAVTDKRSLFHDTAAETIAFLNREMRHPNGAYYSAIDADSDGREGAFYTFTLDDISQEFDSDTSRLIADYFGISREGNYEGTNILYRAARPDELAGKYQTDTGTIVQKIQNAKSKLLVCRNRRTRPALDDKIITSWNALMLIALCRCTLLLDHDPDDALRLGTFLAEKTMKDDTLYRIIDSEGKYRQPGFLDDYALLADGFSRLFELTGNEQWLSHSVRLARQIPEQFYDDRKKAFRYVSRKRDSLIARPRDVFDNAQPAGSSAAITALYRIGHLAGMPEWSRIAVDAMEALADAAANHAVSFGYLLQAMHQYRHSGNEIVIVSDSDQRSDPEVNEMMKIWRSNFDPSSWIIIMDRHRHVNNRLSDDDPLSETGFQSLYGDKTAKNNKTTAYICRDFQCRTPVQTTEAFREQMINPD